MRRAGKALSTVSGVPDTLHKGRFVCSFHKSDHCLALQEIKIVEMLLTLEGSWHLRVRRLWPQELPIPSGPSTGLVCREIQGGQEKPRGPAHLPSHSPT